MEVIPADFVITKVNMTATRKQSKVLRTYGKRSHSHSESRGSEPPAKKRKADREEGQPTIERSTSKSEPGTDSSLQCQIRNGVEHVATVDSQVKVPKGSLLNFFKRMPAAVTDKGGTNEPKYREGEESCVQDHVRPGRRSRPLRLRVLSDLGPGSESTESRSLTDKDDHKAQESSPHPSPRRKRKALEDGGSNLQNQRSVLQRTSRSLTKPGRSQRALQNIQATLNISSQPAFSECKKCDIVWNPLFPDDVAFHKKRHAGILRAEQKRARTEL